MWQWELYCTLFCIGFAWVNYYIIEVKHRRIYHGLNGTLHIGIAVAAWYFIHPLIGGAFPFIGRVWFDWCLSLMRGKPLGYVPIHPKAISDKIEKFFFKTDGITPKIVCLVIALGFNAWYFIILKK